MLKLRFRSPLLWVGVAVFVFASSLASAQQTAIDPQTLIGTWTGTWTSRIYTGAYYLTLTRFENGIYYGTYQSTGGAGGSARLDLEGKLAGDVFTYVNRDKTSTAELKVDGDKMTGEGCGRTACGKISVQKNK